MKMDLDINWDQIRRAADGMIANFGEDALAEAGKRAKTLKAAERHASAVTWECIRDVIKRRVGS